MMYFDEIEIQGNAPEKNNSKCTSVSSFRRRGELRPFCVADAMTRELVTVSPHNTLGETIRLMVRHPFRQFLVMMPPRRVVGIITERDVMRALAKNLCPQTTYARDLMPGNLTTVRPDTKLSVAADRMLEKRVNCLVVVDDKENASGIITWSDVLKSLRDQQDRLERRYKMARSVARNLIDAGATLLRSYKG